MPVLNSSIEIAGEIMKRELEKSLIKGFGEVTFHVTFQNGRILFIKRVEEISLKVGI